MQNLTQATVDFKTYTDSVKKVLDSIKADKILANQSRILLKPNLVNDSPPPVTTPVEFCESVLQYVQACSSAKIIIAEGCGDQHLETDEIFKKLGYNNLSKKYDVTLMDLNTAPLEKLENKKCPVFPNMYLPKIAFTHYIISLPVLKAHSLSDITGALKNMMGFAPPEHYSGKYGIWKKATFHNNMHQSIIDLNTHRCPDLSIMDASVGLAEYHLGGRLCDPPVGKLIAGFNSVELDRTAAGLLGFNWKDIPHLVPDGY